MKHITNSGSKDMSQKSNVQNFEKKASKPLPYGDETITGQFRLIGVDKVRPVDKDLFEKYLTDAHVLVKNSQDLFDYHVSRAFSEGIEINNDARNYLYKLENDRAETEVFLSELLKTMSATEFFTVSHAHVITDVMSRFTRTLLECNNRRPEPSFSFYAYANNNLMEAIVSKQVGPYTVTSCNYLCILGTLAEMLRNIVRLGKLEYSEKYYELGMPLIAANQKTTASMRTFARTILHFYRNCQIDPALFVSTYASLTSALYMEATETSRYIRKISELIIKDDIMRNACMTFENIGAMLNNMYVNENEPPF